MLIADIFVTVKNRGELAQKSLKSLYENTDKNQYRLTIIRDGDYLNTRFLLDDENISHILTSKENEGLGPSINRALSHIDATNKYFEDARAGDFNKVSPFICYCQDDLIYTPGWLEKLSKFFLLFEKQHKLGFATGLECVEHAKKADLPNGMMLKNWIRAAQMFARREYWLSMHPIARFDPETGRVRAKPNDGMGSGVDWWFIRNHQNSVDKTGKTCLVIPSLVKHMGYKESTWLKRELPESEIDKAAIAVER